MAAVAVGSVLLAAGPASAQSFPLGAAVDSALATHPALARAGAYEASAVESASAARARRWPSVSFQSALTRFQEPMLATPIHAFSPNLLPEFDRTLWQSQLFARYTLFDWGVRGGSVDAADAGTGAAEAGTRAVRAELIAQVVEAHLRVQTARAVDASMEARIAALTEELSRAERAFAAGTAAEVEVLRASVALQDAEASRTSTRGAVLLAERTLARVVDSTPERIAAAELGDVGALRFDPADARADATNPTLEQAARRVDAARARSAAERGPRWPRLDVQAGVNQFGTLDISPVFEWQAGVMLSWDLFSGGARSAAIRRSEADVRTAESELAALELEVATATDAARTAIESADARVEALDASVGQWEDLVRIERLALDAGSGTQRDLLDAEAGLHQARAGLVEATAEAFLARVRLAASEGRLDRNWIQQRSGGS